MFPANDVRTDALTDFYALLIVFLFSTQTKDDSMQCV